MKTSSRTAIFWLVLNSFVYSVLGQTVLTGQVRTQNQEPIIGALVEVQSLRRPEAIAVVMTDGTGTFSVAITALDDSLRLSARALGFTEQTRALANRHQTITLTLAASLTKLTEVTVKAPPLRREGDTLSYHVASFTGKQDRVIADVLKKLPGIDVAADGRILYEGRPIQKFYINGQDLLENRYNLASNNLPVEDVLDVQVLKRHQPIAALRSVQTSEQASLNISLKKRVTLTGQGRIGLGAAPTLWNLNLTPMLFTPRQQLLDTYQASNTGRDLATEVQRLSDDNTNEPGQQSPRLTGIQELNAPPLAPVRYLFNQAQLLTANHLLPLNQQGQLRINASYLHDEQTQTGHTRTRYNLPNGEPVNLEENKNNILYIRHLTAEMGYERNASHYYLKNALGFIGNFDEQDGLVQLGGTTMPVRQHATTPAYSLTNRLGLVRPITGQWLMQLNSVITLATSPQQLTVSPGPLAAVLTAHMPYEQAQQQARYSTFYTANALTLRTGREQWHYAVAAGFTQEAAHLASELTRLPAPKPAADTLRNALSARQGRYYAEVQTDYKSGRWHLELATPLSYRKFEATDAPLAAHQQRGFIALEPKASARYELSGLWHATSSVGLRNEFGRVDQLQYGYLLRDYRTLARNAVPLLQTRSWDFQAGLFYENPLSTWFYHVTYAYTSTSRNQLARSLVRPDGTVTTVADDYTNRSQLQFATVSASKFVDAWKMTIEGQFSGTLNQQPLFLNDQLTAATTLVSTGQLKALLNTFAWGGFDYSATLTVLHNRVGNGSFGSGGFLHEQHLGASWFVAERHLLLLTADYYRSQSLGSIVQNVFADATYRYTLPLIRKTDVELKASNLLNTLTYQNNYVSSFLLVQNEYLLRPRQFLLSIRVSL